MKKRVLNMKSSKKTEISKELGIRFIENYWLLGFIDSGGNGLVYRVKRKYDKKIFALKCLKKHHERVSNDKRKNRFHEEIKTLEKLKKRNNKYVILLEDYNISDDGLYWYIMPLGITISKFFIDNKIDSFSRIEFFLEIAKGIKSLHDLNFYHRDIKPANILVVDSEIKLADFGLVWHPSFDLRTDEGEKVGPVETIAPEMREEDPDLKHSGKADVYSFAKTIWMLLLNRRRAFVHDYSYETIGYLSLELDVHQHRNIKTFVRLNELIMKGTEYTPINRPSIDEVISKLEMFLYDNKLPDKEIDVINETEIIKKALHFNKSEIESYTSLIKIEDFLHELLRGHSYSFNTFLSGRGYQHQFNASSVKNIGIESGIILLDESTNKRYLMIIERFVIDKRENILYLDTGEIFVEDIPRSKTFEYIDYYNTNPLEKLIGNIEHKSDKLLVEVITKSKRFVLNMNSINPGCRVLTLRHSDILTSLN